MIKDVLVGKKAWHVECGHVVDALRSMSPGCVQVCATSPPYYGLRKYDGVDPVAWPDVSYAPMSGLSPLTVPAEQSCLGLETTLEAYVGHLVLVTREARRVLRLDGSLWLNIGDSFCNAGTRNNGTGLNGKRRGGMRDTAGDWDTAKETYRDIRRSMAGIKHKDLMLVPHRVALALQADGWWLRQAIRWEKLSPMPESCKDRPTTAHEYVFLLTPSARYYYDQGAVREAITMKPQRRFAPAPREAEAVPPGAPFHAGMKPVRDEKAVDGNPAGRNLWSWWDVSEDTPDPAWRLASEPQKARHFAAWPSEIPRRAFKLGSSVVGQCSACGDPLVRMVKRQKICRSRPNEYGKRTGEEGTGNHCANTVAGVQSATVGWSPSCKCDAGEPVPQICLDIFCGSGVSGMVARELGRRFVGIDASPTYCEMARQRIAAVNPLADACVVASAPHQPSLFPEAP